jgi:hypothetical protein
MIFWKKHCKKGLNKWNSLRKKQISLKKNVHNWNKSFKNQN